MQCARARTRLSSLLPSLVCVFLRRLSSGLVRRGEACVKKRVENTADFEHVQNDQDEESDKRQRDPQVNLAFASSVFFVEVDTSLKTTWRGTAVIGQERATGWRGQIAMERAPGRD